MASPHVAGVAALYLAQNPGASSAQVFNAVLGTTTLNAVTDVNGSPNRLLFSGLNTSGRDVTSGGGGTTAPCSNCDLYSGSLSSSSDYDIQPEGSYYASNGADTGYLQGPDNADFDLYLYRWSGYGWNLVASSAEAGSEEQISFDGSSGYYYWRVDSYSGGGSYEFYLE
jgi:subtilisin family serine protease